MIQEIYICKCRFAVTANMAGKQPIAFVLFNLILACQGVLLEDMLTITDLLGNDNCNILDMLFGNEALSSKGHCNSQVTMEPEAYMTTVEIIQNRGYPAEVHTVLTQDGYILELHRIPHGPRGPSANRPPVFLQHGLNSQSGDWIINFGNQSLGYMLADVGFDVWLGNYRGNTYSSKHISLDPDINEAEYWNFSWQEMGNYDLSASIDYVLSKTGYEKLSYIGHSMGTTALFVLLSNQTAYNAKIKSMVALAPVAASTYNFTFGVSNIIKPLLETLGIKKLFANKELNKILASTLCSLPDPVICKNIVYLIGGIIPNPYQKNTTRLPVYVSHSPAGSSTKTLIHYAQTFDSAPFLRAYDYGSRKNKETYGQDPPPGYDLGKVTVPVALFWATNDKAAPSADIPLLRRSLSNVVMNYRVNNYLWDHIDFIWGIEAEKYINTHIINFLLSRP